MSEHKPLTELLASSSIRLDAEASGMDDAIRQAGEALVAAGAVTPGYVDAMLERERSVSTYVGEGVAVPHATLSGKQDVRENALVVLRFPDGVDWNGDDVRVVIGLAAVGRGHIGLLSRLATILLDPAAAAALRDAATADEVYAVLGGPPLEGAAPAADGTSVTTR
jgi:PTS system mannitol-specific IIA component